MDIKDIRELKHIIFAKIKARITFSMLICFVRIKTAIANIYANAEYIVVLFTELILPSMPKKGNPNISAGTLITRRNRNKLKFEMILAASVFINKCMR